MPYFVEVMCWKLEHWLFLPYRKRSHQFWFFSASSCFKDTSPYMTEKGRWKCKTGKWRTWKWRPDRQYRHFALPQSASGHFRSTLDTLPICRTNCSLTSLLHRHCRSWGSVPRLFTSASSHPDLLIWQSNDVVLEIMFIIYATLVTFNSLYDNVGIGVKNINLQI